MHKKYVMVNSKPVLVPSQPTGGQIKFHAFQQGAFKFKGPIALSMAWNTRLIGHSESGQDHVIGETDPPWHHNFTMVEVETKE